ncbi:MAG: extracellular solute-binding protein [Clostridia bacterium]|nr:extracellular solute-binding protein [Clostridia bacterium]
MKRLFTLLLAVLMLATCFLMASCEKEGPAGTDSSTAGGEVSQVETLVPTLDNIRDHEGKVLRVLAQEKEGVAFAQEPFGASEVNSEPVNDACINRFAILEQTYGFTVEAEFVETWTEFPERVKQDFMTGSATYDVISGGITNMAPFAAEGMLMDLNSIEDSNLSLNESWWDKATQEDMTIAGKLFFATGDIILLDDEFTMCMFYNKGLVDDYGLDNPSELVKDGTWTLDKMYEMAAEVAHDTDNGTMEVTGKDVWGLVCVMFDTYKLVMGADAPQVVKNDKGLPELAIDREYNLKAFEMVHEIMSDKQVTAVREDYYAWNDPNANIVVDQFYDGRALFMMNTISAVNTVIMREANIRYGILPMPKYDTNQENYATTVDPYSFACISIREGCEDTDFVTFALEAMAYLGETMVTPEYYERTLKNKRFPDDDDSPEILEIIFSNRLVDISVAFNWDDCIQYYNNIMWAGGDVVSYVEKVRNRFEIAMNETVAFFETGELPDSGDAE